MRPRENGFVLWDHCQNLLDDPRSISSVMRKPAFWVSDQVQHKLGCTTTEDGHRLEIWDLESSRIVLSM